jgi:spore maturation protein CgeB
MKILIVAWLRWSGGLPILLRDAFQDLGAEVELIGLDLDQPPDLALFSDAYQGRPWHRAWLERVVLSRKVVRRVAKTRPDVFFIYGSNWILSPATLDRIREIGSTIAIWEGNLSILDPERAACLPKYDVFFAGDSYLWPLLTRVAQMRHVHVIGEKAAPDFFRPYEFTGNERDAFAAEVSFFGSSYPERNRFFERLADLGTEVRLWGTEWDSSPRLAHLAVSRRVDTVHKSRIYAASTINLDLHAGHQQINGISSRVFEVLCCGGFVLTEYRKDLEEYFDIGREIDVFSSPEEAKEKIDHYLSHPEERQKMARLGRDKVISGLTISHAAQRMLDVLGAVRQERG